MGMYREKFSPERPKSGGAAAVSSPARSVDPPPEPGIPLPPAAEEECLMIDEGTNSTPSASADEGGQAERKRPRLAGEAANKGLRFFDIFSTGAEPAAAPSASAAAPPPPGAANTRRKPHTGPVVISSSEEDEEPVPCMVCKSVTSESGSPCLLCRTCFARAVHPACSEKVIEDYDNWECPLWYKRRRKAAKEDKKKKKEKIKEKKKSA